LEHLLKYPRGLIRRNVGEWDGTASELLDVLSRGFGAEKAMKSRDWPRSPWHLSQQLRGLAGNLRQIGIEVEFTHTGDERLIKIRGDVFGREKRSGRSAEERWKNLS
jgi:hypothetical protein